MAFGDREQILNVQNAGINRADLNPATLLRRILPGSGIILAGTGIGDETIAVASPAVIQTGAAASGNVLTYDDVTEAWVPAPQLGGGGGGVSSVVAASGLVQNGTTGDVVMSVGAGTGILVHADAVAAASPTALWHANAATPAIIELQPTVAGTPRLGYNTTDKRWLVGTEDAQNILQVDAGTVVASASYGIRLAGPAKRYFSFDVGYDCVVYDTLEDAYAFLIGGATAMVLEEDRLIVDSVPVVLSTRAINTGTGLAGGGNLTADRILAVASPVVLTTRVLTAGSHLSGGGDLAADRRFDVTPSTILHNLLGGIGSSDHHTRYADYEAVGAVENDADLNLLFQGAKVLNSAAQSISNAVAVTLIYNTEVYDTKNWANLGVNNDRITVGKAGYYLITAAVLLSSGWTATRIYAYIQINGTSNIHFVEQQKASTDGNPGLVLSTVHNLAADDYIRVMVYQNSGAAQDTVGDFVHLTVTYLGA